jgi:pyruvate formate-lyase activating enzyme-like uncharacterized protein
VWAAHVAAVREQIEGARVEGEGEVLYIGELAPGCRACKQGTWDCVFTTMRCNLDCAFCYSPHAVDRDYAGSVFGTTPAEIARNHARTTITGVSFSGGEPFAEPKRLLAWAAWFAEHAPDTCYWVYTNGLLASEAALRRLGELGIDEIRFNAAATGYDHPTVMANIAIAARYIPNVTVEIPAIPADAAKLLSCLSQWCALGVRFLNLHELIYEPGTNAAAMPGKRQPVVMPDGHRSAINPESRALTVAVMARVQGDGLPLSVNDCSLQSKIRQLRGRRRCLAPLTKAPHEALRPDGLLESYCLYQDGDALRFVHPGLLDQARRQLCGGHIVRLLRMPPISLEDKGRWVAFEVVDGKSEGGSRV